jgi:4-amino-4-deoxy-L-arabinose transferase-like glycosyltransferase
VATQLNKRDLPWVALIALSFVFGLAASWHRWGNPLVDCGREMNQPLRLASGEMLYSDVRHIYGPLSPYINAALYGVFGPSLDALYADGIITAIIILMLVYWLARQLMDRPESAAATLSVMLLCALKQTGNYILPYSYSALHACALGLATLALMVRFAKTISPPSDATQSAIAQRSGARTSRRLIIAGLVAGLTMLAKTEMGLAALVAGLVATGVTAYPNIRRAALYMLLFITPAVALVVLVYWAVAARVGFATLSHDSFLFLQNLPSEFVYFNKRISGFDHPLISIVQMVGAGVRFVAFIMIVASVSLLVARRKGRGELRVRLPEAHVTDAGRASYAQLWVLLVVSVLLFLLIPLWSGDNTQWDKGPYLAMPLLLAGVLVVTLVRYQKQISASGAPEARTLTLIIMSAYALACLARVLLRVRSGGAYSSYLLPASVVLFTYCLTGPFAGLFGDDRSRRVVRNVMLGLIFIWMTVTAGVLAVRYRAANTYPIATNRGTIFALPDLGQAFEQAVVFIKNETAAGEPVIVMPEGTSLNFFTDRPNPLRDEIIIPGMLDAAGEERAIARIISSNTRLVLITNRATPEFGPTIFGRDYCQGLMKWVEDNFERVATFGPDRTGNLEIGDATFFIRAYRKRETAATRQLGD